MIKLIVIDLDGTLLDEKKKVSEGNCNAIREAIKKGVNVSISTGRSYVSGHSYVKSLGLSLPASYQNGALVLQENDGEREIFNSIRLPEKSAIELVEFAREEGVTSIVFRDFFEFPDMVMQSIPASSYIGYYNNNKGRIVIDNTPERYITEMGIPQVALEAPEEKILAVVDRLNRPEEVSVVKNNTIGDHSFYEFFGPDVGKNIGLKHIVDHLGVTNEEVAYIGDNYNDIDIMNLVKLPIAMANAPDEVKTHAKVVTAKDNDNSGVAWAIEAVLRGEIG